MGTIKDQALTTLAYLPESRERNRRHRSLHLDDLLDESGKNLAPGVRDFIYTSYRYFHAYGFHSKIFFKKHVKSAAFQDLALLAYSTLLSRDKIPPEILVNEIVEAAKTKIAKPLTGVFNAFCRWVTSNREKFLAELSDRPEILLGPELFARWKKDPELVKRTSSRMLLRPESGIWSFDRERNFSRRSAEEFFSGSPQQAMNPGSHLWMKFVDAHRSPTKFYLDACAAPGAKLIWEMLDLSPSASRVVAVEEKFQRMERLKDNLRRMGLAEKVECLLLSLGQDPLPADITQNPWDLILADLPCSGSGTLVTRPDLLWEGFLDRIPELQKIQEKILRSLLALKPRQFFVSICSVDPAEIAGISEILQAKPVFHSWKETDLFEADGITGWKL
jgi:16S rRNA C967 or C1407 C5-methylase (RsmB/RsmF family)